MRISKRVVGHEEDGQPPIKVKEKNKEDKAPKKKQKFSATEEGRLIANLPPRFKAPVGEN